MKNIPYIPENIDLDALTDEQRERIGKLYDSDPSLQQLIDRYEKSTDVSKVLNDDYYDIPLFLADKFGLCLITEANKSIEKLAEAIDHLEAQFRNHRHETGKTYSAKPEL